MQIGSPQGKRLSDMARETSEARLEAGFPDAGVGRVGGCGQETQFRGTRGEGCFGELSWSGTGKAKTRGVEKVSERRPLRQQLPQLTS